MSKVLIAYGSRYGSTEEVSREIAKVLEKEGVESRLVDLKGTKSKEWPSVEEFDGILVGSGIRIMRWTKEPRTFLEIHKNDVEGKVIGIFVCCGLALQDAAKAKKDYIEDIVTPLGIKVDIYDAFGPVFDFSESSRLGFLDRRMLAAATKDMTAKPGITLDEKGKNDFRDWDQIRGFAERFAALVKGR